MDLIETLEGEGTGIAESGKSQVEYRLEIYQHRIKVGDDATIPARKEVHGRVLPRFGDDGEMLTLEFNDQSTLTFTFSDKDGEIAANGEIKSLA